MLGASFEAQASAVPWEAAAAISPSRAVRCMPRVAPMEPASVAAIWVPARV